MKKWLLTIFTSLCMLMTALGVACSSHVHSYKETVVDPTCTEDGYTHHLCDCGESFDDATVEKLGHSYTVYVSVYQPASATSNRFDTYKCERCATTEHREILGTKLSGSITFNTFTVDGTNVSGAVEEDVDEFDFAGEITTHGEATFKVAFDENGQNVSQDMIVSLAVGENVFYVLEMVGSTVTKTYTVLITRPMEVTATDLFTTTVVSDEVVITGVTDYARQYYTSLTVPATIDNKTVTKIGAEAFKGYTTLEEIALPETIEVIADGAFMDCRSLESIVLPDSLVTLGEYAFKNCTGLVYGVVGPKIEAISTGLVEGCTALKKIYFKQPEIGVHPFTLQKILKTDATVYEYIEQAPTKRVIDYWSYDALGNIVEWPKQEDNIIHVSYWQGCYGSEFMEQWKAEFEALYPEYEVSLEGSPTMMEEFETRLRLNAWVPDVFAILDTDWPKMASWGYLEPLDDVYASTAYDNVTIEDFLNPGIRDMGKLPDGSYYAIPWTDSPAGIVYNKTMFERYGWDQSPDTVEDLMALCDTINAAQVPTGETDHWGNPTYVKPFSMYPAYSGYLVDTWWAQYEGAENYRKFFGYESPEVYKQQGRVEALRAYEYLFFDRDEWQRKNMTFGVNMMHTRAQQHFGLQQSAMIVEGAWMQNEAISYLTNEDGSNKFEYAMMRTPLLTGGVTGQSDTPILPSVAGDFMCIPKASNTKEGAKLFLQYVNSKQGCESFTRSTGGLIRPFQYDAREVEGVEASNFMKSCWDVYYNSEIVYSYSTNPITWSNRLGKWPGIGFPYEVILWGEYHLDNEGNEIFDEHGNYIDQAVTITQRINNYVSEEWEELQAKIKDYFL